MGRTAQLEMFVKHAKSSRTAGFVIHGSAGVGKSRLADEFRRLAVREGMQCGHATASVPASAIPLGAIAHLVPRGVDLSDPVSGFADVARTLASDGQSKVVFLVDDLHLLDTTSAVLLRQLMDAGVIMLIGTIRSGEPIGEAVAVLQTGEGVHRVDLAELSSRQIDLLLHQVLDAPVSRGTLRALSETSRGNALYLRELVLGAISAGTLRTDGEMWDLVGGALTGTRRLAELIGARLESMGPQARPVLDLLALCEPVSLADAEAAATPETLAALEEAALIHVSLDRQRTEITLAHPLYGEILRDGLPSLRRREILLAQAQRIEDRGTRRRDDPLHIASWRLAATGTADPDLLLQGARLARYADDYAQVVTLVEAIPEEERTLHGRMLLGEALSQLGEWDRAEVMLAAADTQAMEDEQRVVLTVARTTNLFWVSAHTQKSLAVNSAAQEQVESPAARCDLRINEGSLLAFSGRLSQGLKVLQAELGKGEQVAARNPTAWLTGAAVASLGLALSGRSDEAITWADRAITAHRLLGEPALVPHPLAKQLGRVMALSESGRFDEARTVGECAFVELVADRAPMCASFMALLVGRVEWLSGRIAAARRWYAESSAVATQNGIRREQRLVLSGLGASAALLSDFKAVEVALGGMGTYPPVGFFAGEERLGEAWSLAQQGRVGEARRVLLDAASQARQNEHVTSEGLLLTDAARLGGATETVDRLTELGKLCDGELASARAHFARCLVDNEPGALMEVSERLAGLGADLLAAEAASAAAAAYGRAGRQRLATGAAARTAALAARCQGARTPALVDSETAAALTQREREVALLAAKGASSKEIADELIVSVRTVDNHLQHAYTKLGVSSRRGLAKVLEGTPNGAMDPSTGA
ncbi:LuxR C-terminal-related transcriptional regulator [Streptomyces sp. Lzd4kr]|nr:LuxR C-terminal-related transcriptional regulator [Streptomyces sp. Lzd4kr]